MPMVTVSRNWFRLGDSSSAFLLLVMVMIIPLLFYVGPCWAIILGVETHLLELDRVLALAYVTPVELGHSCFCREVLGSMGIYLVHTQWCVLSQNFEEALDAE